MPNRSRRVYLHMPICISLLLLLAQRGTSQLCTGSLGDPIVNIDFGAGTSRGAALGADVTAYTYSGSGQLGEAEYTIANTTEGLKGNAWLTSTDHTGNGNGYMMVVNCAILASEGVFYKKTISGLCPNTTYEFSAWIMNVMRQVSPNPNVTFRVSATNGTLLGSYTTGEIPVTSSPTWKQCGFFFSSGSSTEVIITILNSAPSAVPGNDLALDDITFRPCGPNLSISTSDGLTEKHVCIGDQSSFTFISSIANSYSNPSYQWQVSTNNGAAWTDIQGATTSTWTRPYTASPGTYLYRLNVAQGANIASTTCRVASGKLTITVHDNPDPAASSNNPGCEGDNLQLSAAAGAASYKWTGPNGFASTQQSPVLSNITAAGNGTYSIQITTSYGCSNTGTVTVSVHAKPAADAGTDVAICEGASTTLTGQGGTDYQWAPTLSLSNGTGATTVASPTDTTNYVLTVSNGQCKANDTVTVFVWKKPVANAGADQKNYEGTAFQLSGTADGSDVTYNWTPTYNISNATLLNPIVTPATDTTYTLHVVSSHGCGTATDQVFIRVYKKITIPNAFSPNGDGINDTWKVTKLETYPEADISVFNRYGQLVFHSNGYGTEWNGRSNGQLLPVGTYYYVIDLKTGLGNPSGWVVILR